MPSKGEAHFNHKLTESDVIAIRRLKKKGYSRKYLAEKFGVGIEHISRITNRVSWKHVKPIKEEY